MVRSGYVARIRKKIGPDLLALHAVSIFVFDKFGRFLLAQQHGSDSWVTIGGAVEVGETPAAAAVREFHEETGAIIRVKRVLGIFGGPDLHVTYANGDAVAYTSVAFEAELTSGEVRPDGVELRTLRWVSQDDARALPMMPGMRLVVEKCAARPSEPFFQREDQASSA